MYKLIIASDLDGTLLPEGQRALDTALFDSIARLRARGVLFCCASGRTYRSLLKLFTPAQNDMVFMAENGALAYAQGRELFRLTMPRALCAELVSAVRCRDDCYVRVNTLVDSYILDSPVVRTMGLAHSEDIHSTIVDSFDAVKGEITQVTAISPGNIEVPAAALLPAWSGRIGAAITGEHWLDFTSAGKDVGLLRLCEIYGVPQPHTVAFGDNFNDVPMLRTAAMPFLMANAAPALRAEFRCQTESVLDSLLALEQQLPFGLQ